MQRWNIDYLKRLHAKYEKLSITTDDPTLSLEYESTANSILDIIDRYDEMVHKRVNLTGGYEVSNHKSIVSSDFKVISSYRGKLLESANTLLKFLKESDEIERRIYKLY